MGAVAVFAIPEETPPIRKSTKKPCTPLDLLQCFNEYWSHATCRYQDLVICYQINGSEGVKTSKGPGYGPKSGHNRKGGSMHNLVLCSRVHLLVWHQVGCL